jgi:predicted secreted hydrolase
MRPFRAKTHLPHRRRRRLAVAAIALAGLLAVLLTAPASMAKADTPNATLPADESPHPATAIEWWYFTGHLTGTDIFGKKHSYGFEDVAVRSNILNVEPVAAAYNGQFAITDLTRGAFDYNTSNDAIEADTVPAGGGYNIAINTWNMHGKNGQNHLFAYDTNYGLDLSLNQSQPAALHGDTGLIPYGSFGTSYYYSETNLKVTGTVIDHGLPITVTGTAWQDHQWGNYTGHPGGWTWFALQLSNGTQYMLYFLKDANGNLNQVVATKVNADGTYEAVPPSQVSYKALGSWTSPATKITYEQNWQITLPGGQLTVNSLFPNQEVVNSSVQDYWEGDSSITGTIDGQSVTGQAYAEVQPTFTVPSPL